MFYGVICFAALSSFGIFMGKAALCVERESHVKDSYYGCPLFRFAESAFHDPFYLIFAS
jgi:hypothetical protein